MGNNNVNLSLREIFMKVDEINKLFNDCLLIRSI